LALLLELLLSFSVGKSKEEFDTILFVENTVEFLDDTFGNFAGLKSGIIRSGNKDLAASAYLAKPTSLLTPDGASRQILVETA